MRVFVVGTGRCGSVSFREACRHATNYTAGHESKCGLLEYPDAWIEVNPQLRCCIPHLAEKYPDASWVHLVRTPETCIPSLAALGHGSVMHSYRLLHNSVVPSDDPRDVAYRYYWAENDAIRVMLAACVPETQRMVVRLEDVKAQWADFWRFARCEGDYEASLRSWDVRRNTREERGEKR